MYNYSESIHLSDIMVVLVAAIKRRLKSWWKFFKVTLLYYNNTTFRMGFQFIFKGIAAYWSRNSVVTACSYIGSDMQMLRKADIS